MNRITDPSNVSRCKLLRLAITTKRLLTPIGVSALTPPPGPQSYTLRAEALFQMGERAAAIADLDQALRLAPDDIAANRRMLAWAEGARKSEAALNLIARERDIKILREAIEVLRAAGRQHIAHATVYDDAITRLGGLAAEAALEITITSDTGILTTLIEPDSSHAFRGSRPSGKLRFAPAEVGRTPIHHALDRR